jgi:hypothetical protein
MAGRRLIITVAACAGLALPWLGQASPAGAAGEAPAGHGDCSAGARTLSPPGSVLSSGGPRTPARART